MTSDEIVKKIFGYDSPLHTYYEFIRLKGFGNKISGSLGNALTIDQVLEVYEPEILRYLFVGTKPKTNFNISFDNDIIKIYDEFDLLERKYYENLATPQERRIYELSKLKITKEKPKKENFRHLITLVQIKKIKDFNKENKIRAEKVSNWIDKYASDDFKFEVQKTINKDVSLSDKQKKSLVELKKILETKKLNEDQLFNEFYNICNSVEIKNNDFFEGAYNVIINRNKGPRLTNLIVSIGKEKIIKLLGQIK